MLITAAADDILFFFFLYFSDKILTQTFHVNHLPNSHERLNLYFSEKCFDKMQNISEDTQEIHSLPQVPKEGEMKNK